MDFNCSPQGEIVFYSTGWQPVQRLLLPGECWDIMVDNENLFILKLPN